MDQPVITDFGLARQIDDKLQNTVTGDVLGTPSYMSPEQASSDRDGIDRRSDVYSIGVILYELLTGRKPFINKGNVPALLEMVKNVEPTPLRAINPKIQRDLETICLKCLQKKPTDRYQTALDLADDIGRYRRGEPIVARRIGIVQGRQDDGVASILECLDPLHWQQSV